MTLEQRLLQAAREVVAYCPSHGVATVQVPAITMWALQQAVEDYGEEEDEGCPCYGTGKRSAE